VIVATRRIGTGIPIRRFQVGILGEKWHAWPESASFIRMTRMAGFTFSGVLPSSATNA
jgi:hypothetical protein